MQKHGYIIKKRFIVGYPSYWCFTKLGVESYGGTAEPKFVLQNIKHDSFVTRLLIDMLQKNTPEVKTEFELKHEIVFDKNNNKNKKIKIPDLVIGNVAVEVELTQKNLARINAIIREYRLGKYEQVIYYTTNIIAKLMSNITEGDGKFKYKIIDELDINKSVDFINLHNNLSGGYSKEKQDLRDWLGI